MSGIETALPFVVPLIGAGPDDDELKRVTMQAKNVQKRLRAVVDDRVAMMKDDALSQGYNGKDEQHRKQMSKLIAEFKKGIRTRLGIFNKRSEIQNNDAVAREFRTN